ncbi:MAG: hypothetical protein V8Q27_01185 [Eubacteriales bacterium]
MITDKKIVVIGSGVSGVGAVKLLEAAGAAATLYDSNEKLTEAEVRGRLSEGSRCTIVLGAFSGRTEEGDGTGSLKSGRSGGSAAGGGAAGKWSNHLGRGGAGLSFW